MDVAGLTWLAKMICGDTPYDFFPYRSSSYLTMFFSELDLDYVHDGSTRHYWVSNTLQDICNHSSNVDSSMPPPGVVKVIENLLNPIHFLHNNTADHGKAIEAMIKLLKIYDLTVIQKKNKQVVLRSVHRNFVSTSHEDLPIENLITFKPSVFKVPSELQNKKLISVMMPFTESFTGTYDAVKLAVERMGLECRRSDDIWNDSVIVQDIFSLIFCATIVVVDFTGRNPNVMYETGIAHTLGKTVIPITQSINDVPFDLGHHRVLKYLPNEEGYIKLSNDLQDKLKNSINGE